MDESIKDKEWLDLAWKYFQMHAQQRISYFNYFVIFSTILSTCLLTTFQKDFQVPFIGIFISLIQMLLSIIFWKIDGRNKFLTKHAETVIKRIETDYSGLEMNNNCLFCDEEVGTRIQKEKDKNKNIFIRQISHGKSYNIIYSIFFFLGLLGLVISSYNFISKTFI